MYTHPDNTAHKKYFFYENTDIVYIVPDNVTHKTGGFHPKYN